jgi:DNA-directed RNA polymerase subunit H
LAAENVSFNVLTHDLVPEHRLLTEEETDAILKQLKVTRDQLPKIRTNDPAVKVLESNSGKPIEEGSVVKVVRKSSTAEEFVAYRLVVKG